MWGSVRTRGHKVYRFITKGGLAVLILATEGRSVKLKPNSLISSLILEEKEREPSTADGVTSLGISIQKQGSVSWERERQLELAEASSMAVISRLASASLPLVQWLSDKSI